MRVLALLLLLVSTGCVSAFDYERVRGELTVTRDENARLRDENRQLQRELGRATTKLSMIDSIIHGDGVAHDDGKDDWREEREN